MIGKEMFKNIFKDHWEGFKKDYPEYDSEYYDNIVLKMLGCGSDSNGYTEYKCISCGECSKRIAFTCKSGFCLSCGKVYSDKIVSRISQNLHSGVTYRHIVLTVPEQLRTVFYNNRKTKNLFSEFIKAGYQCLEDVINIIKRQLIKVGATIMIHTHGRSGSYNPHLHIILTSGGINTKNEKWVNLGYFSYEVIHKKWQFYLLQMVKDVCGEKSNKVIDLLWKHYPNGFVANVSKGDAPQQSKGLAKYLAKYIASPPISIKRIISYTGRHVTYWYKDHETKKKKTETVSVFRFIGRMVQHIMPKGFQRIRYYGLQATKSFNKWCAAIKEGFRKARKMLKDTYQIITFKKYRNRCIESTGKDPFLCSNCKGIMQIWKIWHPKYGLLFGFLDTS